MNIAPKNIQDLKDNEIFIFGSNTDGRHGAGAAAYALKHFGAVYGKGVGLAGQSYAIPTRKFFKNEYNNWELRTLELSKIARYVYDFIGFASVHKEKDFLVSEIGCGHAGLIPEDIAPLFAGAITMSNVFLPQSFIDVLNSKKEIDNGKE